LPAGRALHLGRPSRLRQVELSRRGVGCLGERARRDRGLRVSAADERKHHAGASRGADGSRDENHPRGANEVRCGSEIAPFRMEIAGVAHFRGLRDKERRSAHPTLIAADKGNASSMRRVPPVAKYGWRACASPGLNKKRKKPRTSALSADFPCRSPTIVGRR